MADNLLAFIGTKERNPRYPQGHNTRSSTEIANLRELLRTAILDFSCVLEIMKNQEKTKDFVCSVYIYIYTYSIGSEMIAWLLFFLSNTKFIHIILIHFDQLVALYTF